MNYDGHKLESDLEKKDILEEKIDEMLKDVNFNSVFINIYSLFETSVEMGKQRYAEGSDKKHENIVKKSEEFLKNLSVEEKMQLVKNYALFIAKNN